MKTTVKNLSGQSQFAWTRPFTIPKELDDTLGESARLGPFLAVRMASRGARVWTALVQMKAYETERYELTPAPDERPLSPFAFATSIDTIEELVPRINGGPATDLIERAVITTPPRIVEQTPVHVVGEWKQRIGTYQVVYRLRCFSGSPVCDWTISFLSPIDVGWEHVGQRYVDIEFKHPIKLLNGGRNVERWNGERGVRVHVGLQQFGRAPTLRGLLGVAAEVGDQDEDMIREQIEAAYEGPIVVTPERRHLGPFGLVPPPPTGVRLGGVVQPEYYTDLVGPYGGSTGEWSQFGWFKGERLLFPDHTSYDDGFLSWALQIERDYDQIRDHFLDEDGERFRGYEPDLDWYAGFYKAAGKMFQFGLLGDEPAAADGRVRPNQEHLIHAIDLAAVYALTGDLHVLEDLQDWATLWGRHSVRVRQGTWGTHREGARLLAGLCWAHNVLPSGSIADACWNAAKRLCDAAVEHWGGAGKGPGHYWLAPIGPLANCYLDAMSAALLVRAADYLNHQAAQEVGLRCLDTWLRFGLIDIGDGRLQVPWSVVAPADGSAPIPYFPGCAQYSVGGSIGGRAEATVGAAQTFLKYTPSGDQLRAKAQRFIDQETVNGAPRNWNMWRYSYGD